MIDRSRRIAWLDLAIALATLALAFPVVWWADQNFLAVEGSIVLQPTRVVDRPEWIWNLYGPYRRLQKDYFWLSAVATLGIAVLVAKDRRNWSRRGRSRPGTIVVAVTLLIAGMSVGHFLMNWGKFGNGPRGPFYIQVVLNGWVPGAILGAWVVNALKPRRKKRPIEGRERLARSVGWIWMANVGLIIAYGILFG